MNVHDLPEINAALNCVSTLFLGLGYRAIRRHHDRSRHRRWMVAAVATSTLFLLSYLVYHFRAGSVPYPLYDWTRSVYFAVLVPHVLLATAQTPFVLLLLVRALRGRFDQHARLARRVFPVWMFVSVSGVAVYLLLYGWAGASASVTGIEPMGTGPTVAPSE